jgi:hypothetical protein
MAMQDHSSTTHPGPAEDLTPIQSILLHAHRLIRKELDLLKAEVSDRIGRAGIALAMIAVGGILLLTGLDVLAAAAVAALVAAGLSAWLSAILVAGGVFVIAALVIGIGVRNLKQTSFVPHDTLDTLERDARVLKETIENDA